MTRTWTNVLKWIGMSLVGIVASYVHANDLNSPLKISETFRAKLSVVEHMLVVSSPDDVLCALKDIELGSLLTGDEPFVIETMRVRAWQKQGNEVRAVQSLEKVLVFEKLTAEKSVEVSKNVGIVYANSKNYPIAACWLEYYQDKGGTDKAVLDALAEIYSYAPKHTVGADGRIERSAAECEAL